MAIARIKGRTNFIGSTPRCRISRVSAEPISATADEYEIWRPKGPWIILNNQSGSGTVAGRGSRGAAGQRQSQMSEIAASRLGAQFLPHLLDLQGRCVGALPPAAGRAVLCPRRFSMASLQQIGDTFYVRFRFGGPCGSGPRASSACRVKKSCSSMDVSDIACFPLKPIGSTLYPCCWTIFFCSYLAHAPDHAE